ncbi:TCPG [Hepatospora eriocheir]|uniref:TCPG n=1 Tax=Hepatospora eriocheir TaxID=1081669 RepID=A0A1X0QK69_9MICR|nr:TCPG [Hepatospora eriocheir]
MVKNHHPIRINRIISYAKDVALQRITNISVPFNKEDLYKIVHGAVSTKICSILKVPMAQIAITAIESINNGMEIDIKNNIKIEKIIGDLRDTKCLDGLMFMKDIFHPAMRTSIENPKVLLIDFPLEYKKGESATKLSLLNKDDFTKLLEGEENQIRRAVDQIVSLNPDIVVTEKGISDIALGLFASKNITALRRFKKIDAARLARLSGGTTVSRPEDLQTRHLGSVGQFNYEFINNDWYCIFHKVKNPKAVTVVISGPSKDINAELERNLFDALKVAKNVMINPKLVPGGGASEYAVIAGLREAFADKDVVHKKVCNLICRALQSIPSILAKNLGADNVLELLQKLENEHLNGNSYMGINGVTGDICDVRSIIMDPIQVKEQCYKSAFDIVIQLLRVDGIVECKTKQ